jgi:very-short-patch-repair endonuclease/predicted transcriptional regulator of viral defense system
MGSKPQAQPDRRARIERELRERELAAMAQRQHGVVARRQLRALGIGDGAIKARLRMGQLHAVHRGVYSLGHQRLTIRGAWLAAVLAYGDGSLLSHRSAAALWGLMMRTRRSPVEVTSCRGRTGRAGILLHYSPVASDERSTEAGIPVTTVARTLLDLAEVLDGDGLRHAFEEADRLKLLRMPELERVCSRAGKRKGLVALRRLIAAAREPITTRSPLENRFAEFFREHLADLPAPLTNVSILDHEVDAYWPGHRLVVEIDGWGFHGHRAAFEHDRARDAAMQAEGYRVIRLTHRQLETEAPRVTTQLRTMLSADRSRSIA